MRDFAEQLQASPVSVLIQSVEWIIPLVQTIHILTIGVVFVSMLMIALRVLGAMRADEPFGVVLARFSPWLWIGLGVMAATGLILVIGEPVREFSSTSFWIKMALVAVAIGSAAAFRLTLGPARLAASPDTGAGESFAPATRYAAIATIVLWLAIIFLGRAIAYDIEVWGPWSLSTRLGG
jgi:hypothetical protein